MEASLKVIEDTLKRGGEINFTGFGKFSVADRGARQGVNPQTGERIQIRGQPRSEVQRRLGSEEVDQGPDPRWEGTSPSLIELRRS